MVVGGGECIDGGGVCGRVVGICGRVVRCVGGWYRPMAKDCVGTLRNTAAVTVSSSLHSPSPSSHSLQGVLPHAESSAGRSGADGCPQLRRDTHEGLTAAQQGAYMYCTYPLDEHIRTYAHQVGPLSGGGPHSLTCPSQPFPPPPHLLTYLSCPSHPSTSTPHSSSSSHTPPSPQVFLQHLSPLLKLGNFQELWLGILGVLEKYCLIKDSDSLVGGGEGGPLVGVAGHALLIWISNL